MPRKTDGEKIDEMRELNAALTERVNAAVTELNAVYDAHSKTAQALSDLRREHEKELVLLKREIEDLKKWKEE